MYTKSHMIMFTNIVKYRVFEGELNLEGKWSDDDVNDIDAMFFDDKDECIAYVRGGFEDLKRIDDNSYTGERIEIIYELDENL